MYLTTSQLYDLLKSRREKAQPGLYIRKSEMVKATAHYVKSPKIDSQRLRKSQESKRLWIALGE